MYHKVYDGLWSSWEVKTTVHNGIPYTIECHSHGAIIVFNRGNGIHLNTLNFLGVTGGVYKA